MEKEEIARVEKFAQTHFDRVATLITSSNKTVLAWIVALLIIWQQVLEPRLIKTHLAQASSLQIFQPNQTLSRADLKEIYASKTEAYNSFKQKQTQSDSPIIELPFSIKLTLQPESVPTLWLCLALGLAWYLYLTRLRILRLAARGLVLFQVEARTEPSYIRTLVGTSVWWLAPFPTLAGKLLVPEDFQRAMNVNDSQRRNANLLVAACVCMLIALELRVFYIGFCISSYQIGNPPPPKPGDPFAWLALVMLNAVLVCGSGWAVWRWFVPSLVPDHDHDLTIASRTRREFIAVAASGAVVAAISILSLGLSAESFSWLDRGRSPAKTARGNKRRKRHRSKAVVAQPPPREGFYKHVKTGTVHIFTTSCKRCVHGVNYRLLVEIDPSDIDWAAHQVERRELTSPASSHLSGHVDALPAAVPRLAPSITADRVSVEVKGVLHQSHQAFMIEHRALQLVLAQQPLAACELLLRCVVNQGKRGPKPNMRLYDLLAGLCVRYEQPQMLTELVSALRLWCDGDGERRGDDSRRASRLIMTRLYEIAGFKGISPTKMETREKLWTSHARQRIVKWTSKDSAWWKRWADKAKPLSWKASGASRS